ncbi:uncharacterized protein [Dermacentor andersoni]|uniref:uncharacterized protein n=1 Tax=Dermacentor andersoni TaxID=34620 RepID=UPI002154FD0C|nr:uncharacterized protein LOC126525722 [Dermacentor andersoni]
MDHSVPAALEELDPDELDLRFPGLDVNVPCTADAGADDEGRIPESSCHLLEQLSAWNRFLWHVGLQLRELRAPGKLSLVRVVHMSGGGGLRQTECRRDARLLFQVLLQRHRCVVSVELDEAMCEGSGLGEYRERVVSALQRSTSLQALTFDILFCDCRWIREEMFGAIAKLTNLQELVVSGTGAAPPVLLDAICTLLLDTTSLATLSMLRLVFDAEDRWRLVDALTSNVTVENLSLHGSIVHSYLPNGRSRFSIFLVESIRLRSLSLQGDKSDPAKTFEYLMRTIPPLVVRGILRKLKLSGFLLNADCASLLAVLVARKEGLLEHLDIGRCRWRAEPSPRSPIDAETMDCEKAGPSSSTPVSSWHDVFNDAARVPLSFLRLSFAGLEPENLAPLFNTAATVEFLGTISLRDVALGQLKEVCRVVRETGMGDRVRIEGVHLVDSASLSMLKEFPEALRHVVITSLSEPRLEVFQNTVRLACSWYQLTALHLLLTQKVVRHAATMRLLSKYVSFATALREFVLTGCQRPDLSLCLRATRRPHSALLEAICENVGIQALRIERLRLGTADMRFLAKQVVASETLCEVYFASSDELENEEFVDFIAADLCENSTILRLRVLESADGEPQEGRFAVEDVLGRNMGYVTCAAHFVVFDTHLSRCEEAYVAAFCSPAVVEKVQDLAYVDAAEATRMIRSILE